jgi:hypothetical protein
MTFVSSFAHEALDENVHHIEVFPRLKVEGCSYDYWDPFDVFYPKVILSSPFLISRVLWVVDLFLLDLIHVFERLLKPCFKTIQEFL